MNSNNNFGMVGGWHEPNSQGLDDLKGTVLPGDRLEFHRYVYQHWGIYVGKYDTMTHAVIDFGKPERWTNLSEKAKVKVRSIEEVLGDWGQVRINNVNDKTFNPLPVNDIVRRARVMHKLEDEIEYNILTYNCEHLTNSLRYDVEFSDQVFWFITQLLCIGVVVVILKISMLLLRYRNQ